MGERAKFLVNEYVAKELIKQNNLDLDKFYSSDLKIFIKVAQQEIERLNNIIDKAIEWCECVVNAKSHCGELPNGKFTDIGYCLDLAEPLLNILRGDNNE